MNTITGYDNISHVTHLTQSTHTRTHRSQPNHNVTVTSHTQTQHSHTQSHTTPYALLVCIVYNTYKNYSQIVSQISPIITFKDQLNIAINHDCKGKGHKHEELWQTEQDNNK